jgi:hypothetical protein
MEKDKDFFFIYHLRAWQAAKALYELTVFLLVICMLVRKLMLGKAKMLLKNLKSYHVW